MAIFARSSHEISQQLSSHSVLGIPSPTPDAELKPDIEIPRGASEYHAFSPSRLSRTPSERNLSPLQSTGPVPNRSPLISLHRNSPSPDVGTKEEPNTGPLSYESPSPFKLQSPVFCGSTSPELGMSPHIGGGVRSSIPGRPVHNHHNDRTKRQKIMQQTDGSAATRPPLSVSNISQYMELITVHSPTHQFSIPEAKGHQKSWHIFLPVIDDVTIYVQAHSKNRIATIVRLHPSALSGDMVRSTVSNYLRDLYDEPSEMASNTGLEQGSQSGQDTEWIMNEMYFRAEKNSDSGTLACAVAAYMALDGVPPMFIHTPSWTYCLDHFLCTKDAEEEPQPRGHGDTQAFQVFDELPLVKSVFEISDSELDAVTGILGDLEPEILLLEGFENAASDAASSGLASASQRIVPELYAGFQNMRELASAVRYWQGHKEKAFKAEQRIKHVSTKAEELCSYIKARSAEMADV
ncbi:hypothetical protein NPX13_g9101 [Xylaria arbuscula]|uniref:Uncharacterized protein n=1 Tax=Xylaria arbuscula TaxID=114810 RepID=A0A9W8N705_9PEZI|nr:hypothetical protein NPX13_g9101 [Xylaria arbuscula]